jgi:hypothetical protein
MTVKESERARGTHILESTKGQTRFRKETRERGALACWSSQRDGQVRVELESERGALTDWKQQREGLITTEKQSK